MPNASDRIMLNVVLENIKQITQVLNPEAPAVPLTNLTLTQQAYIHSRLIKIFDIYKERSTTTGSKHLSAQLISEYPNIEWQNANTF